MRLSRLLFRIFLFLLPPAVLATAYLYLYPLVKQCCFPSTPTGKPAPFRLLALADPQLEGDTSLPDPNDAVFPHFERLWGNLQIGRDFETLKEDGRRLFVDDLPKALNTYRKMLDLWGNDLYLAHVYRSMQWFTDPTHVVVLGDLLGSQWIGDGEFESRTQRFWERVFKGGQKVPERILDKEGVHSEVLGKDRNWKNRIIAVAGNHDVGYAGDLDEHRVRRFKDAFGRVNWEVRFNLDDSDYATASNDSGSSSPAVRLVILNSMNLDEPAKHEALQEEGLEYLNQKLYWELPSSDTATVLLTHIPLYKEDGVCVDGPFFDYFSDHHGGGIKEQNHLSYGVSERILEGMLGPERSRKGIILNGHDHEGCQVYHSKPREMDLDAMTDGSPLVEEKWEAVKYSEAGPQMSDSNLMGLREVTVRSMMGSFDGNAGLLSAWWDAEAKEWKFEYASCMCGVQHIWWAVHVFDIIVLAIGWIALSEAIVEDLLRPSKSISKEKKTA
ncbi:hypothetical protein M409DRAFT_53277 [Zasmidium cellare ATCC 36951]|uniref:Calcineurin-like phosphoesterase domain-containing protein n=1 Tax=Zasmidium cellare ATCC 36951 TaxID=1080233 RepID=A0A6A6CN05_ZASCE|nr:uncharacterized protein M409DRAFT_53277 [Zasmidium cellare ATCC 36951]KAF2168637.1 hypothetical protein M409DRAFT_53277 [Zasmidium cellare ATCC 36951]